MEVKNVLAEAAQLITSHSYRSQDVFIATEDFLTHIS